MYVRVCTVAVGAFTVLKVLFDFKHVHRKEHKGNCLYQVVSSAQFCRLQLRILRNVSQMYSVKESTEGKERNLQEDLNAVKDLHSVLIGMKTQIVLRDI